MTILSSSPLSLDQRINTATRPLHHKLNHSILSFLPLALPPHSSDPTLYARGTARILPIYEAFERQFQRLLVSPVEARSEIVEALCAFHMPGMERGERLRGDLDRLLPLSSGHAQNWLQPWTCSTAGARKPTDAKTASHRAPSQSSGDDGDHLPSRLQALVNHIADSVSSKPYLILTYAHMLYLAHFSGGRHIRSRLRQAGHSFWECQGTRGAGANQSCTEAEDVLTFWSFDTEVGGTEGEDALKAEFKRRFLVVESHLSEGQKEEIVAEALDFMHAMLGVVKEIALSVHAEDTDSTGDPVGMEGHALSNEKTMRNEKAVTIQESDLPLFLLVWKHIFPLGTAELFMTILREVRYLVSNTPLGIGPEVYERPVN